MACLGGAVNYAVNGLSNVYLRQEVRQRDTNEAIPGRTVYTSLDFYSSSIPPIFFSPLFYSSLLSFFSLHSPLLRTKFAIPMNSNS